MNLSSLLNEFPPVLCRLLVRPHQSNRQLATVTTHLGYVGRVKLDRISKLTSWNTVTVGDTLRFLATCKVDFNSMRRHREFIRRANWSHITTPYQRRLFKLLVNSRTHHAPNTTQ